MNGKEIDGLIDQVKDGSMPRRDFVRRMLALGLSVPAAGIMLSHRGVAWAQGGHSYKPTKAGGGGPLKLLYWQGPTLLNPHFAVGTKDQMGCRIFYEPLATWDMEANLVPVLAEEAPSLENGAVTKDGRSVTWKIKKGVKWHDGAPLTADDLVFNHAYTLNPATAAVSSGNYANTKIEKVDDHTIRIVFDQPNPFWSNAFVGAYGQIIPKHLFEKYIGDKSRDAPANLSPVGTGPYKFVEFRPGDILRGERNPNYHRPNRPFFDTVELKGGGDAVSAARAVLQTGEYDYAWNMQVEDEQLKRFEASGKGRVEMTYSNNSESIFLNATDPNQEVDGERSSPKTKHFAFSDPAVRKAMGMLIDRDSIQKFIYGRTGRATANVLNGPEKVASKNTKYEFNIAKAEKLLEDAGWKKGGDGIRAKDGKKLKLVYQTSINAPRQKTQAIIKQAAQKAGIDIEIKSIPATVFFSSDVANPDTYGKFYSDIQMLTFNTTTTDPSWWMQQYVSWQISNKENKWQGRNLPRFKLDEADRLFKAADQELDPVKRAELYIKMNDVVVEEGYIQPLLYRAEVGAYTKSLKVPLSGWDLTLSGLSEWYKEG